MCLPHPAFPPPSLAPPPYSALTATPDGGRPEPALSVPSPLKPAAPLSFSGGDLSVP
jgi:hypothetical protein